MINEVIEIKKKINEFEGKYPFIENVNLDNIEEFETFLFDILEFKHLIEDKIERFNDTSPVERETQLSFLMSQLQSVKNVILEEVNKIEPWIENMKILEQSELVKPNKIKFDEIEIDEVIKCKSKTANSNITVIMAVVNPASNEIVDIKEAINTGIINPDEQTYISDLKTKEEISWIEAIYNNMIIAHEIKSEILTPKFIECIKLSIFEDNIDVSELEILKVVNTDNGNLLDLKAAEKLEIIDLKLCIYHDILNDKWISLKYAILNGLVLSRIKGNSEELYRVFVDYVRIGKDQRKVNLKEAISEKCINSLDYTYHILEDNVEMTLIEAIMCGIINIIDTPEYHEVKYENFLVINRRNTDPEIKELCQFKMMKPLNVKIIGKLQKSDCWNEFVKVNDIKETVTQSIYNDHLELDPIRCGERIKENLLTECLKGNISFDKLIDFIDNMKEAFIGENVKGFEIISNGKDIKNKMESINKVNKNDLFIMSCDEMYIMSTDKLEEKMDNDLFFTRINVDEIEKKLIQLSKLEDLGFDTNKRVIADRSKDKCGVFSITMMEAVINDIMLLDSLEIIDKSDGNICSLEKGVEKRLIDSESANLLLDYVEQFSFDILINDGIFNVERNSFGDEVSLLKAIEANVVEPNLVYVSLSQNNEIMNLSKLIDIGVLDAKNNEVLMEDGTKKKLSEAITIESGMLLAKIDIFNKKRRLPKTLRKIKFESTLIYDKDRILFENLFGEGMKICDALNLGLLCEDSLVQLCKSKDGELKRVIYCDNIAIANLINKVNKMMDNLTSFQDQCINVKREVSSLPQMYEADNIENLEMLLFELLEEEKHLEDQVDCFKSSITAPRDDISPIQLSFLIAQMENAKNLSTNISHDIKKNQNLLQKRDITCSIMTLTDEINQSKLRLNNLYRDLQKIDKFRNSLLSKSMSLQEVIDHYQKIKENQNEMSMLSPKIFALKESIVELFDCNRSCKDDSFLNQITNLEKDLISLKTLRDNVLSMVESLLMYFGKIVENYRVLELSLNSTEAMVKEMEMKLLKETKTLPLNIQLLDNTFEEICKIKRDVSTLQQNFDKLEKNINEDLKGLKLYTLLESKLVINKTNLLELKNNINCQQKNISQVKSRLNEMKVLSNDLNDLTIIIQKSLNDIKLKDKDYSTFENVIEIKKQFIEIMHPFEQLRSMYDSYIHNPLYVSKDKILYLHQNVTESHRELYMKINEELILQVKTLLKMTGIKLETFQGFIVDLSKTWSTDSKDVNENITKIKSHLDYLKEMKAKLQYIDLVLNEDLEQQFDINLDDIEIAIADVQSCENDRLKAQLDFEKILDIVCNSYLPTIMSYDTNKQISNTSLTELSSNIESALQEFNTYTKNEINKSSANFINVLKDQKEDLQRLKDQLIDLESFVDSVESYGFDIIEQQINLTSDYGSESNVVPKIKEDMQLIIQKFKDLKTSVYDFEMKINEFLTTNIESVDEQINNQMESWMIINDLVNRMEPIKSRPEKMKEQANEISLIFDQIKQKESDFHIFKQSMNTVISDVNEDDNIIDNNQEDGYTISTNNTPTVRAQEISNSIKDIEILIESIFYKVENRIAIIKDIGGLSNIFWMEITSLNNTISQINKIGNETEVFPNNTDDAFKTIDRFISEESESPSLGTACENRSSTVSPDLEFEGKPEILRDTTEFIQDDATVNLIKPELIMQQNYILMKMDATVEECIDKLQSDLEPKAIQIIKAGGQSCAFEVNDYLENVWENVAIAKEILGEKHIEIDQGLYLVNVLIDDLKKLSKWFSLVESQLCSLNDVSPDQKMIELNINQLKTLNAEVFSQFSKIEKLSSVVKEILIYPYVPNKFFLEELKANIDNKYNDLARAITDKHGELQDKYLEIGELNFVLDDNIGIMQELENQIKHFSRQSCKGDPQYTASCLKNLKLLSKAFGRQRNVIDNLNETVSTYADVHKDMALESRGGLTIFGKLKEINDISSNIKDLIPQKEKLMEEILKNEKMLSKDIHKFINYLDTVKGILKYSPKIGLTKVSVDQFSFNYVNCMKELSAKEDSIKFSIELANVLIANCPYEKCSSLTTAVKTLCFKHKRCLQLAVKREEKLSYYSKIILDFDKDKLSIFKDILDLENMSLSKANPSKLTKSCYEQIKHVKINIQKAEKCLDILESLNIRSFEIKCYGNKFDNSQLYLELKEYGLKLAKIQKCLRERLRIFIQAYKEDKLFSDSYDILNNWLDESYIMVESFKQDPNKVQEHLDKLKNLCQQLSAQYANFHCTIRYGSYLKDRCLETDPERGILIEMLKTFKVKWIKIRNLIIAEKTSINRKMIETGNIFEAIKCFNYWINEILSKFDAKMKLCGDLDTVEVLIMDCRTSLEEADNHIKDFDTLKKRMFKEIKNYEESEIRTKIIDTEVQFIDYLSQLHERKDALKNSLEISKDFNNKLDDLRLWIDKADKQLKLKSLPKFQNETELINLIEKHEIFLKKLNEMKIVLSDAINISKVILTNCYPTARNYVNRIIFTLGNRCNKIQQRTEARSKKLNEALGTLRGSTALIEELIQKVAESITNLRIMINSKLPTDIESTNALISNHTNFHNQVIQMDVEIKNLIKEFKVRQPSTSNVQDKVLRYRDRAEFYQNIWRNSKDNLNRNPEELTSYPRLNLLNTQFNVLWKLSVERKTSLQSKLTNLNEQELLKKFDFSSWRGEFINFVKNKGLRLTDLFRKQSVIRTGYLTEDEFFSCITKSGFPTNKSVLKEVFQLFNRNNDNMISYQEFIDAMRPERRSIDTKCKNVNLNDKKVMMRIIHDIIEKEVAHCGCSERFFVKNEGGEKYRFGSNNKMYMVRYLNSSVMVRIGGGWQNLKEFLKVHDPCRAVEKPSIQMSAGDHQKLKGLKMPTPTENKTGTLSLTSTRLKQTIESKSSSINSPRSSHISSVMPVTDSHEGIRKEQLSTSMKSQPSKASKPLTKK